MFKWLVIVLLVIIAALGGGLVWIYSHAPQPVQAVASPPEPMTTEPNTTVIVHQSIVNGLLASIFPIEGAGKLLRKPIEIPYSWRVENLHVELTPDGPIVTANARVNILGKGYPIAAQGKGDIRYDSLTQELYMDLHELRANTNEKILGIPLDRLNLAPSELHILILRHLPLFTNFKVKKPEDIREDVQFAIVGHRVRYEKQRVLVDLSLRFKEQAQYHEEPARQTQTK